VSPLTRPCRHPWCPHYQPCPRHAVLPFGGSHPMPPGWPELRAACLARDQWTCRLCGAAATDADHIVPRSQGGKDELANLRSLCHPCHLRTTGATFGC
jgi:5-methylcytosine-specific restriction endonuclease McrA